MTTQTSRKFTASAASASAPQPSSVETENSRLERRRLPRAEIRKESLSNTPSNAQLAWTLAVALGLVFSALAHSGWLGSWSRSATFEIKPTESASAAALVAPRRNVAGTSLGSAGSLGRNIADDTAASASQ